MSNDAVLSGTLDTEEDQRDRGTRTRLGQRDAESGQAVAVSITKAASKQTYYTIRFLADRNRVAHAYRAYAYFRWVDDWLDRKTVRKSDRVAFAQRQRALIDCGYRGEWRDDLTCEEQLLMELTGSDQEQNSGLQCYIRNMMAVMAFDAERRGRLISQCELAEYSRLLAIGVTEALHYFIGHDVPSPWTDARYPAVTGAHIAHMLRDTYEDIESGYFNIPREFLALHRLGPCDVGSGAYRLWVESRVRLARECFTAGRDYLAQVGSLRCRIAGYAYMARFEGVLNAIEQEGFRLRVGYPERKSLKAALGMARSVLAWML